VAALVDTNILVYRFDSRFPEKQEIAHDVLRRGILEDSVRLPHQTILEFVAVVTRPLVNKRPLLTFREATREAEELLAQFRILYPNEALLRLAFRGAATYQLSWFDAHMWAYAEHYALEELISEDFQHDRLYGTVKIRNPFLNIRAS
jgi:predicted nucleic acid-binding protein